LQVAPQTTEHVDEQLLPEQVNGPQLAKFTHCQNLLQFPEPSHLFCCWPLVQDPWHVEAPVVQALVFKQFPAPEQAVS
jgi:hypothetical protein